MFEILTCDSYLMKMNYFCNVDTNPWHLFINLIKLLFLVAHQITLHFLMSYITVYMNTIKTNINISDAHAAFIFNSISLSLTLIQQ